MEILNAHIKGFGKLQNTDIQLTNGLNIIYGKNEAGKSTAHSFIKSILFGINNKKTRSILSPLEKYTPWDNTKVYEGSIDFSYNKKTYTIYRTFGNKHTIFEIVDNQNNKKISEPELFLNKVMSNLTETSFDNTISISQLKSVTDIGMVQELKKYIANINTSGDISIDTIAAIEYLKNKRKIFEDKQIKDATVNYTKLLGTIRNAEREITADEYKNLIPDLMTKKKSDDAKIKKNTQEIEELNRLIDDNIDVLKVNGFETRPEIDTLKIETEKIYNEYLELQSTVKRATKFAGNILMIISGLGLGILNTIFLTVAYPQAGNLLNLTEVINTFSDFKELFKLLPFPPAILIVLLYVITFILFISGSLSFIRNAQSSRNMGDMLTVLTEIFNHQINTTLVNSNSMIDFQNHISDMYDLMDSIDKHTTKIKELKLENDKLLDIQEQYNKEIDDQKRIQHEVEQKVDKINKLKSDAEKLKKYISYNDDIQREIDSINLSIEMLSELSQKVQVMFGTYINERASKYLAGISNNKYNSINVDNNLNVTVNTQDRTVPVEQLSAGTIDQIYLSLRLAIAQIINGDNENLPLLFDDCFALYDNDRLRNVLLWLYNNYKGQIIIFTCHTRENEVLQNENITYNKIDI